MAPRKRAATRPESRRAAKAKPSATEPYSDLVDDPTLVWNHGEYKQGCSCRVITNTRPAGIIVPRVQPGVPVLTPTTITGDSSEGEWTTTLRIRRPAPCIFEVRLPGLPPPNLVARALAEDGAIAGLRFNQVSALVTITVRGTYHVQPKPGTAGVLRATYDGAIIGSQTVSGRAGMGESRVEVKLSVQPFDAVLRRLQNAAAGPGGRLAGQFGLLGGAVGGPFRTVFGPVAATVPCCTPQNFTIIVDVEAKRGRGFVDAEAILDRVTFTVRAPDPPAAVKVQIHSIEVNSGAPAARPDPVASSGYRVRRLAWAPAENATALAVFEGRLVVAVRPDPAEPAEIVQIALDSHRIVSRAKAGGAVGRLTAGFAGAPVLFGLIYEEPKRAGGPARMEKGRVISIDRNGRQVPAGGRLDLPVDLAVLADSTPLVADLSGRLFQLLASGRKKLMVEGLKTPIGVAVPPRGSPWRGSCYLAEAGELSSGLPPRSGRIVELYIESCHSRTVLEQLDVTALAFANGGRFQQDLLIAMPNDVDRSCGAEIPNTGQVMRLAPDGALEAVLTGIDSPLAIALDGSDKCFVLGSGGIYEVTARR
jgi:hypothetical protein